MIRLAALHPEWVLGFLDEVWFSRFALPRLHAWTTEKPLRLKQHEADKADPDPQAIALYGLLRADTGAMKLRFTQGRPVSAMTTQFLEWLLCDLATEGKKALLMIWDNASWHKSREVRAWIKAHNQKVKQEHKVSGANGCRLIVCALPTKSPWLNNIEPKWGHGKRAVVEPDATLTAEELKQRLCDYYGCELLPVLAQPHP